MRSRIRIVSRLQLKLRALKNGMTKDDLGDLDPEMAAASTDTTDSLPFEV